ncbi:MAG: 4Fe-4S dicluster domain-containing protein [Deferrisomatales bacterium]|nr:4Fe-4S dicluster domain-containing protein [Deferrisomatales bacterium]
MEKRLLKKEDLAEALRRLSAAKRVLGPVRVGDNVVFGPLEPGREPELAFRNTRNAPKNVFFPHTETLMRFTRTPKGMEQTGTGNDPAEAVVLVRPCDAQSFLLLDRVFDQPGCRDPYYTAHRDRTAVVALACSEPPYAACFCTSVGGDPVPADPTGVDVLLTDLGNDLLAEFLTEKGRALLPFFEGSLPPDEQVDARKDRVAEGARGAIRSRVPAREIKPILQENFDHPFWADLHGKCLACGTCTYICPTCHCFDISDEVQRDDGVRLRSWDSCMFPLFTKEASGHNPRSSQKERWRQRVMHKFRYIPENFDLVGCVGCGRCVLNCPVNLDIRKIVQDVARI